MRPEWRIELMTQAPHCVLPDKAIISAGPVDAGTTYQSLYFYTAVFPYFSHCLAFCFGSTDEPQ